MKALIESFALKLLRWTRPGYGTPPIPDGHFGVSIGKHGVSYFGPEESKDANAGAYAVLALAMVILVRDADLNRTISEAIVQAAIEIDLGQDTGEQLAAAFVNKELEHVRLG